MPKYGPAGGLWSTVDAGELEPDAVLGGCLREVAIVALRRRLFLCRVWSTVDAGELEPDAVLGGCPREVAIIALRRSLFLRRVHCRGSINCFV
jgi:hypothetical protein